MPFHVTTALKKMIAMKARKRVIQGATSSGKTYGLIPIMYDYCLATPRCKATVVAETLPAVKEGPVDIFMNFMYEEGRFNPIQWNATSLTYTCLNGSKLQFKSFDSVGKAKAAGKRDALFINEANHIPYEIADALIIRSREIWMDFNADSEFWAHTHILPEPNSEFLKLTYLDNEAIPKETLEDLLNRKAKAEKEDKDGRRGYWWNWWQVYGLGEIGSLQGVVFNNWKQIESIPEEAVLIGYGVDFGYTNDPTSIIEIYKYNGQRILNEVCYRTGMLNSDISKLLPKDRIVYADSAEPKSIEEIRRTGVQIKAVSKGKDSIMYGIDVMQRQEYLVTARSTNLIKELRNYSWAKDRDGNTLNQPIGMYNHAIDAVRYHEMETLGLNQNYGSYSIY